MYRSISAGLIRLGLVLACLGLPSFAAAQITQIIDASGDGAGNGLNRPEGLAVDAAGNVFVAGRFSDNAFRITPGGEITEILDESGDGVHAFAGGLGMAVDTAGNAYVGGCLTNNVFRITPAGEITQIIDAAGDGFGHNLLSPTGVEVDAAGNVFVAGGNSVFKVTPAGEITVLIDNMGDGAGNLLRLPECLALDVTGNVYVAGCLSDNAFRIGPDGTIMEIIDGAGDGTTPLDCAVGMGAGPSGNVFVSSIVTNSAFRIGALGAIRRIIGPGGDGLGHALRNPQGLATDGAGNVYVTGFNTHNAFQVAPGGVITELIDQTGDGEHFLLRPSDILADSSGHVYVGGTGSNNVFEITLPECFLVLGDGGEPGSFGGSGHVWSTQVSGVSASYAVTLVDMPTFRLPVDPLPGGRNARRDPVVIGETFAQVLMWNPTVFPANPEQSSEGLHVRLWSNGRVTAQRYGTRDGMSLRVETSLGADGRRYVRFPFTIDGL